MFHATEREWGCFSKFSASYLGLNCPEGDDWGGALKTDATASLETFAPFCQTTWHHVPQIPGVLPVRVTALRVKSNINGCVT
jgi:hypothetical protein